MFNILCQFVPVLMYVSYKSDSSFLSSLSHHGHFLVFYQIPPSHNKMHQQAWPAVILLLIIKFSFGKLCEIGCGTVICTWSIPSCAVGDTECSRHSPLPGGFSCGCMFLERSELTRAGLLRGHSFFLHPYPLAFSQARDCSPFGALQGSQVWMPTSVPHSSPYLSSELMFLLQKWELWLLWLLLYPRCIADAWALAVITDKCWIKL